LLYAWGVAPACLGVLCGFPLSGKAD
jgi:hypothetical protein